MNKIVLASIAASLAFATPAFADDAHHPEKGQEAQASAAKTGTKTPEQAVKKMQDNVKIMQAQLDRIAKAKTDQERQKAMAEHMQTMQENMKMARGMHSGKMGCMMMEGGMMGGGMGMMGKGGMGMGMMGDGMQSGGSPEHMQQMEKRMDMMQMMMEQMMRRQEGQQPMPMK